MVESCSVGYSEGVSAVVWTASRNDTRVGVATPHAALSECPRRTGKSKIRVFSIYRVGVIVFSIQSSNEQDTKRVRIDNRKPA